MFYWLFLACIFYRLTMLAWLKKLGEADPTQPMNTPNYHNLNLELVAEVEFQIYLKPKIFIIVEK